MPPETEVFCCVLLKPPISEPQNKMPTIFSEASIFRITSRCDHQELLSPPDSRVTVHPDAGGAGINQKPFIRIERLEGLPGRASHVIAIEVMNLVVADPSFPLTL